MKKSLLFILFSLLFVPLSVKAQNPDAIYIATWSTMSDLGKAITPNDQDPKLTYNSQSGCYEGEVIDWPRLAPNPYNAKIPYSVSGNVITYYGVEGPTEQFIFNNKSSESFQFTSSTDPAGFKGFGLSMSNEKSVVDVKVSMNLSTNVITFTEFESGQGTVLPTLVSVNPENGTEITPDADGGTKIILSFSGEVTSLEAICDGNLLPSEKSSDGKTWTILVSAEIMKASTSESQGKLGINIQKVYANSLPVSFENGSPVLNLVYTVAGITNSANLKFTGSEAALSTLCVYKSPEYSVGDEVEYENNQLAISYSNSVTYLFTAGSGYEINITSTVDSKDGANWKLGKGNSTKKGPNGETTNQIAAEGVTLTIYPGAKGADFTINVGSASASKDVYISGLFNGYNPAGNSDWQLFEGDSEEGEAGIYTGYFQIGAGEFSFNFQYGDTSLVPVANGGNVVFADDKYSSSFTEGNAGYWINENWEGGELGIVVNLNDKTVLFQNMGQVEDVWFIRGAFNNYNPAGDVKWALNPAKGSEDNGLYEGTFEVKAGEFSFNLLSPLGAVFIPSTLATQEVSFTDNIYEGMADMAYEDKEESYYWTNASWAGGKILVSINSNNGEFRITDVSATGGIEEISVTGSENVFYNLQGVRVDSSKLAKGIYILNGKKVLVK